MFQALLLYLLVRHFPLFSLVLCLITSRHVARDLHTDLCKAMKGPSKKHKVQITAGEDRHKFLAPRAFA
jgi:hypothetical protein